MAAVLAFRPKSPAAPVLDLSGPRLRRAFEDLAESAEPSGGVERYVGALALKASLFEELLGKGRVAELTETEFCDLAAFVTPVRRRIGAWLRENSYALMHRKLIALLSGWSDVTTADARMAAFCDGFPADRAHRWARDLAAEVLHFTAPDRYPLMTRWMWDARVGSGVLREIWFADDVDRATITAADDFAHPQDAARRAGRLPRTTTASSATCHSTSTSSPRISMPATSTIAAASISATILSAARPSTAWPIPAACSASTRSIPSPAAPA